VIAGTVREENHMLKTLIVILVGTALEIALGIGEVYAFAYVIPQRLDNYLYFPFSFLIGACVGLFVGLILKKRSGAIALVCILPGFLMLATHLKCTFCDIGMLAARETMEMVAAFVVADRISKPRQIPQSADFSKVQSR
jgi:hypothetical protein